MKKNHLFSPFGGWGASPSGAEWLVRGLLLVLLFFVSCKKQSSEPEPDLPPETQQGADTFGCYLNGKPWKPSPNEWGSRNLYVQLDGQYFVLYAKYDEGSRFERIDFFSDKVTSLKEGEYPIKKKMALKIEPIFGI